MTCEMVEECLLDYIEGQLDDSSRERVRLHIDACPACRIALRDTKELLDAMHAARENQERAAQFSSSTARRQAETAAPMLTWQQGAQLGDFEIIELMGRGGMGAVYRAKQVSLNRIVALKVLPAGLSQSRDALTRFRREAQAAAKLHHTHIVPVYAQGEHEGHLYYAMELIDGVDLGRIIKNDYARLFTRIGLSQSIVRNSGSGGSTEALQPDQTELPNANEATAGSAPANTAPVAPTPAPARSDYRRLARLIAMVADALAYAHKQGVLHRDIKPQNLLLGTDGQLHVTDFGLARLLDEPGLTLTGEIIGTPAYMSPEQVDADRSRIDHRTDIYSLGVTLYEVLTGQRPFDAPTREQTIARIRHREAQSPRRINPLVPIDLETICLRAMDKEPRSRYQNAAAMAADLLRYADDKPILSRRVGPIEKSVKWIRRHPALTTIITLSILMVIGAVTWTRQSIAARRDKANGLVQRAFTSLTYDDYREPNLPLKWLAEASSLNPDPARFAVANGMCKLLTDAPAAIADFQRAQSLEPDNVETLYLLAWAYRLDQQLEAYQDWLARADRLGGPRTAEAHFFRGQAHVRLDPEAAIEDFRAADRLSDSFYQAKLHLGRALNHKMYHERTLEVFDEARRMLLAASTLRSKAAYPRYLFSIANRIAAEIYRDAGNDEASARCYQEALRAAQEAQGPDVEPDSPRGYACEAEYWESIGDLHKSLDARDRCEPHCNTPGPQVELHEYRWRLCFWLGLHDRAASDLAALAKFCPPNDPKYPWYLHAFPALLLASQGHPDEAAEQARQLVARAPHDLRDVTTAACLMRILGRSDEANAILEAAKPSIDFQAVSSPARPVSWMRALYDHCRRPASLESLATLESQPAGDRVQWAEFHFFAGCHALERGDRAAALSAFADCEKTYDFEDYSYFAKVLRVKLEQDRRWPFVHNRIPSSMPTP